MNYNKRFNLKAPPRIVRFNFFVAKIRTQALTVASPDLYQLSYPAIPVHLLTNFNDQTYNEILFQIWYFLETNLNGYS